MLITAFSQDKHIPAFTSYISYGLKLFILCGITEIYPACFYLIYKFFVIFDPDLQVFVNGIEYVRMVKAYRIQETVHGVHFDWKESEDVLAKIRGEIKEFETEKQANDHDKMEEEFGDILFSLINYGHHLHINPEDALEKTNRKFINRFNRMEQNILAEGKHLPDMSVEEMEKYWQIARKDEK